MFYNRTEVFRHSFGHPPEAVLQVNSKKGAAIHGLILDISQEGAKIFAEKEMKEETGHIHLSFILHQETIQADASLMWKKPYIGGWIYGMKFKKDPVREMLIANELAALKKPI